MQKEEKEKAVETVDQCRDGGNWAEEWSSCLQTFSTSLFSLSFLFDCWVYFSITSDSSLPILIKNMPSMCVRYYGAFYTTCNYHITVIHSLLLWMSDEKPNQQINKSSCHGNWLICTWHFGNSWCLWCLLKLLEIVCISWRHFYISFLVKIIWRGKVAFYSLMENMFVGYACNISL